MSRTATTGLTLTIPVRDGCLMPSGFQKNAIAGYLAPLEGKDVTVRFARPVKVRSNNQNRLYWGVYLAALAEHTGHTPEELHDVLKAMFLPREFVTIGKLEIEVVKSTTKLTTDEFNKYLTQIEAWCNQELGIRLPTH